MDMRFHWGGDNVLELDRGDGFTALRIYQKASCALQEGYFCVM